MGYLLIENRGDEGAELMRGRREVGYEHQLQVFMPSGQQNVEAVGVRPYASTKYGETTKIRSENSYILASRRGMSEYIARDLSKAFRKGLEAKAQVGA